jgi:(heptosyl)LPS beta-1,4-glucosyltransferase
MKSMNSLSVTILTKNEELLISRCIKSVAWADEVLVIDSGSTDKTCQIATNLGATVYEQKWLGWSAQHQKAIDLARHDWILVIDADEIVTPLLEKSIKEALSNNPPEEDGFSVDRKGDFFGILLPNTSSQKNKRDFVRLFNRKHGYFDENVKVHEKVEVPGNKTLLHGDLIHWRGRNMDEYIDSINQYSRIEAEVLNDKQVRATILNIAIKPIARFVWCYIVHREFMLGTRGLIHSILAASSEYIRYVKLWEMQQKHDYRYPEE